MNKVFLIGNLTKDPEVNVTSNDLVNCKFSVAVTRNFNKKETDFFTIVCWRGLAENCGKYLRKGSRVGICGSIQNKNYESDGIKRYSTEIVADEVQFLTSRAESEEAGETIEAPKPTKIADLKPIAEDNGGELPF